jgi:hypothetical protein
MAREQAMEVLVIPGIPGFYDQFGYELALDRGGGIVLDATGVDGRSRRVTVRPATRGDVGLLGRVQNEAARYSIVQCIRNDAGWAYEIDGHRRDCTIRQLVGIIENDLGDPLGAATWLPPGQRGAPPTVRMLELLPGMSWSGELVQAAISAATMPLTAAGEPAVVRLELGREHPAYDLHDAVLTATRRPYAWCVRVPDVPRLMRRLQPIFEHRLADSRLSGYTGELAIGAYRWGVRLVLERGRIVDVSPYAPTTESLGDVSFPGLSFLHLLFAHRTLGELEGVLPDVLVHRQSCRPLVEILFPRLTSNLWTMN